MSYIDKRIQSAKRLHKALLDSFDEIPEYEDSQNKIELLESMIEALKVETNSLCYLIKDFNEEKEDGQTTPRQASQDS